MYFCSTRIVVSHEVLRFLCRAGCGVIVAVGENRHLVVQGISLPAVETPCLQNLAKQLQLAVCDVGNLLV